MEHLEPESGGGTRRLSLEEQVALSQAISLKRIADVLCSLQGNGGIELMDAIHIRVERMAYDAGLSFSRGSR